MCHEYTIILMMMMILYTGPRKNPQRSPNINMKAQTRKKGQRAAKGRTEQTRIGRSRYEGSPDPRITSE